MKVSEIKSQLTYFTGEFPTEAVQAAVENSDLITPILLTTLEEIALDPHKLSDTDYMLPMFAFYLLAEFKEEKAYPLIIRIFSHPGDLFLDTINDFVDCDLGRVLASVCGSNIEPIKALIGNKNINEFTRSAGLSAIQVLVAEGKVKREIAIEYFSCLFKQQNYINQKIMTDLVCICRDLGFKELMPEIKQAYTAGLVNIRDVRCKDVEKQINQEIPEYIEFKNQQRFCFIENCEEEMNQMLVYNLMAFF